VALPRDPGGRPRPALRRHPSFPVPKPEIQRSAPPRRRPVYGPPAPRRRAPQPVGVFRQPITPPTRTLQHAQRQAAQRTRRAAAKIPQPAPSIPVIAPRNQPRGYQEAVRRVAGPLVQRVHAQAIRTQQRGGSYRQSISEQLDALGPQARRLFRDYLTTVAKPNAQKLVRANLREQQRRVAMGLTPTSQLRPRSGGGGALATLGSLNPLTAVPRFLAGPLATRVQQSGGSNLAGVLRLAREPTEIARTYAEHPATIGKDFQYARDFLLGTAAIPYSVIHKGPADSFRSLVDMAKQAPRALLQDEIARHKEAFQGNYGAFRKVVEQTGASPYILDYATLASGVGKGAGLLAKSGGLGRRLEEFANRPRAELRIAPGEARRQRDPSAQVAPNLLRMGMQQRRDAARVRSYERGERKSRTRAAERNLQGEPGHGSRRFVQPEAYPGEGAGKPRMSIRQLAARRQALEQVVTRAGGKLSRDQRGRVDSVRFTAERAAAASPAHFQRVTKRLEQLGFTKRRVGGNLVYYAPREVVHRSLRREAHAQRSIPAHLKGVAVNEIRGTTAEEAHAFNQAAGPAARALRIKGLSKHERAALFLVGTGRLPADNPAAAIKRLNAIEKRIRAEHGPGKPPSRFATDTLKRIDYLRRHADQAFTPRLREAVLKIGEQVKRGERANPFLVPRQRAIARYGPGALELGVERGRVAGEAFDPVASAKSIARHREKVAGRERGGFVGGEAALHAQRGSSWSISRMRAPLGTLRPRASISGCARRSTAR
jgi:hypothetical protein